jgi:hypothetical protein
VANCEFCGNSLPEFLAQQQPVPSQASTQEADAWLEKLNQQRLESFYEDYMRFASRGDDEGFLKWLAAWNNGSPK